MSRKSSLLLLIITAFNLVYDAYLPLHPDEAYYWAWSKHLQLSYYDHPPMIAYLIRLATLAGDSEFVIRLVAVACMTLSVWVIYRLARNLFTERVADIAILIMLFLPVIQAQYLVATPDAPLILFWALTLYCIRIALWEDRRSYFAWAGTCGGCLLLSKYTGVLLFPAILLFLLFSRHREVLPRRDVYVGMFLAILLFSPVIIWNAQHDWLSFRYQLMHGMGGDRALKPGHLGDFFAGQALVANPVFLLALLYYAIRYAKVNLRDEKLSFLLWPFLFTFAFFLCGSLFKKSEANWTIPAYLTGAVLLAYWIEKRGRRWILYAGVALTVIMVVPAKFPEAFPVIPKQLVLKRQFMGYREMFRRGRKYAQEPGSIILSDSYQRASEAWYYLGGRSEVYVLNPGRVSMYDFWRGDLAKSPAKDAVFFGSERNAIALRRIYADVQLVGTLHYENRFVTREMKVYRCVK